MSFSTKNNRIPANVFSWQFDIPRSQLWREIGLSTDRCIWQSDCTRLKRLVEIDPIRIWSRWVGHSFLSQHLAGKCMHHLPHLHSSNSSYAWTNKKNIGSWDIFSKEIQKTESVCSYMWKCRILTIQNDPHNIWIPRSLQAHLFSCIDKKQIIKCWAHKLN